mgnify:CR=1 FL=1
MSAARRPACTSTRIAEIIDPDTGEVLPEGTQGELVFTSITKQAFPLLRYRTRDICILRREACPCGRTHIKMCKPMGRSDDMLIVKGVNVFPSQIETVLLEQGYTSNYQIVVDRVNNSDTLDVLEAAGLDVSELRDPGRHLIVRGRDTRAGEGTVGDIEFVIVRPGDAPAFVGCGGADCGICGWDSLIEADLNLLQLVDLGYGLCTFIEAEPAWRAGQAERNYARRGSLRVATKYPRIASAWYAERGVNADIVSLHGNIELGPIVGMTDRIVDITATGATLRDNDLVITGRIMDCTARFFVNPGAARLDPRVRNLADRLAAAVKDKHFEPVAGSAQ